MRCTPGVLRLCLFVWHEAAPCRDAIFSRPFVTRSVTIRGVSHRISPRGGTYFGVPLLFFHATLWAALRSFATFVAFPSSRLFLAAFESAPGHAFLAGDSTFFRGALPRTISGAGLVQVRFLDVFAAVAVELPVRAGSLFFSGASSG